MDSDPSTPLLECVQTLLLIVTLSPSLKVLTYRKRSQDESSILNHSYDPEVLSQDTLRKYVTYAKLNVFPNLYYVDLEKLTHVYLDLQRESSHGQGIQEGL
jgi:DNA replicative helicase MCM subunit Mcm2 (Cdc46/Mcm family)